MLEDFPEAQDTILIKLPRDDKDQFKAYCALKHRGMSEVVAKMIRDLLKQFPARGRHKEAEE